MLDLSSFNCLGESLRKVTKKFKPHTAIIEANRDRENGRWTYDQFQVEAERVAALLQDHALQPGDRCAILMSNQSKWVFSATGAFWTGAILVPLDYKLTAFEQIGLLEHAKPKMLITEWPFWVRFQKEEKSFPKNIKVFVTEAPSDAKLNGAKRWEEKTKASYKFISRKRDDVACIIYSSGTGGRAKGCMLTHENYLSQLEILSELYPITSEERYFSIIPTNHAIDFVVGFLYVALNGATIVYQRTLRPEFLASTMKRYGITCMTLVPMLLKGIERKLRERLNSLPFLKQKLVFSLIALNKLLTKRKPNHAISKRLLKPIHDQFGGNLWVFLAGGAYVEPATAKFFYDLGIPVAIGYGLTEAGSTLSVNVLKDLRFDSVGKAVPRTELEIRNKNNSGIGEVWVKGPTVMKGYFNDPDLTKETIVDGWLRTGDLGFVDDSGHLHLVGRTKNMIVTEGGKNIYPEDLEITFEDLSESAEHCVFATNFVWPSGRISQEHLMIVVRPNEKTKVDALAKDIRKRNQRLADYKRLSGFVVWEKEFPRTASMKVKREALAEQIRKELDRRNAIKSI